MTSATPPKKTEAAHVLLEHDAPPFAGKYKVERVLGQGGMGIVFEARHIRMGQRVAIKVLGSELREYPELVERFEREARAAGSLTSSHTVRVFDIDATEDGTPFIVMELLSGRDLSSIVERDGPQPIARAVRWIIEACEAISEAHRMGIIHRDLKPSNLFLTDVEGRQVVKVLDFGIAKRVSTEESAITAAVAPLGTPQYMSPEQVRCAKDVDLRSDIWSLGVTLYEIVCGTTPFSHESSYACIASIAADPVPDPRTFRSDLPEAFVEVLMRALAKNVGDRYATVDDLVAALAPFALDDVFDDEELVSAVRRAYERSAAPNTPRDQATLDAALAPAPRIDLRQPLESRPDRTIPPAISHAIAPRKQAWSNAKSALAVASVVMLGAAAFVFTPRWLDGDDSAKMSRASAAVAALPVSTPIPVSTALALPTPIVTAPAAPVEPAVEPAAEEPPVVAVATPVSAPAPRTTRAKVEKNEKKEMPPPSPTRSGANVHGGLSNPGF